MPQRGRRKLIDEEEWVDSRVVIVLMALVAIFTGLGILVFLWSIFYTFSG